MTEQNNVGVIRAVYEAFGRGDLTGVLQLLDAKAELQFEGPAGVPWTGHRQGHEEWMRFFGILGEQMDDLVVTMEPFAAHGDHVVAAGRYRARVKATGKLIDSPLVHLWTLRDGLVVRCVEMTDTAAELAACTAG